MATNLIEQCREYIAANGGYAAVAASIGVSTAHAEEVCLGRRQPSPQFAVGMAPLIGAHAAQIMAADVDYQFLSRKGML